MLNNLSVITIIISLSLVPSYSIGNENYTKPKFKHLELLDYGVCRSKVGAIDLSKALYLQNTSLSYFSENSINKFYLSGQDVIVQKGKSDSRLVFSINDFIEEHYKLVNPDIDLSFVLINNELSIYWKETFLHRSYKQGIIKIYNNEVVAVCDGVGGVDSSH